MAKQDLSKQFPDLHYLSIESVGKLLRSGAVSVTALTQYMLARIDSLDKRLCAYSTVLNDRALNAATTMDAAFAAGQDFGPLHGIPVAVKDLCCMAGIATTGGIKARQDYRPVEDATVVKKLEAAGAIILGKLNQTEGALMGYQEDFSIPINPWGKEYWPGFSSSGTGVAVAAGLCYAGIGTDTGGSIRLPAMANGVVGLKPSYGRVSRAGTLDLAASMDHIGPLTRCSRDAALTLQAIAGVDPRDSSTLDAPISLFSARNKTRLDGIRIGYDPNFTRLETEPEVVAAIEAAMTTLATLGAKVIPVEAPTVPADII